MKPEVDKVTLDLVFSERLDLPLQMITTPMQQLDLSTDVTSGPFGTVVPTDSFTHSLKGKTGCSCFHIRNSSYNM
jgi:hypothetical protein